MSVNETLVELDDRRRASLGKIARPGHRYYSARVEPDGTIILAPVVIMTAAQVEKLGAGTETK